MIPLPDDTFDVILADPPWQFHTYAPGNRSIENHYDTMDLDDICAMPVSDIAANDSVLWMNYDPLMGDLFA